MPTITNKRYTDLHPFTPDSTLKLTSALTLSPLSVISCNLFPVTTESSNCACITAIYRSGTVGKLNISTSNGSQLCTVSFPISLSDEELAGTATDVRGLYCGTMTLRADWVPLFYGNYSLDNTVLKLLPSACRLLVVPENAAINKDLTGLAVLKFKGQTIEDIRGSGDIIKNTDDGTLYLDKSDLHSSSLSTFTEPIKRFKINGQLITVDSERLNIVTTGGGLQVSTNGNEIIIGEE